MANKNVNLKDASNNNLFPKTYVDNILDNNERLQQKLVSGNNIKTINSTSILGDGNIAVQPTITNATELAVKTLDGGLVVLTEAPTSANANGIKFVYLESEPETKYSGYIYLIKESE